MIQGNKQLIFVLLFLCLPAIVFSQNVEKIIAKHIAAHGGAEKWRGVEALKITGSFTAFSLENNFTSYKTKSGKYYSDRYLGEKRVLEAFDGKKGWTIDPWQEIFYARNLNSAEENVFRQKAEFFTPFYNYKEKGHKVEFVGKEKVDGAEMLVLKLTRSTGGTETWYLNAKTYLEYKCESQWVDFARAAPSESYFDDFRKVEGLVIPFYIERIFRQRNRMMQIEKVELNPEFEENLLEMPQREEIEKLGFLQGDWDVKWEIWWNRRNTWYPIGATSSHIDFVKTNVLQETIRLERGLARTKTINYTYNDERGKFRVAEFDDLSYSFKVYEGDFNDKGFEMTDLGIQYGSDKGVSNEYTQYCISSIDKDHFTIEVQTSRDKGKTWKPSDKFSYTRKNL
ncbi:MAG: hypothetical protein ACEPOZ_19115 [Marinifilaceae bacterium]